MVSFNILVFLLMLGLQIWNIVDSIKKHGETLVYNSTATILNSITLMIWVGWALFK